MAFFKGFQALQVVYLIELEKLRPSSGERQVSCYLW